MFISVCFEVDFTCSFFWLQIAKKAFRPNLNLNLLPWLISVCQLKGKVKLIIIWAGNTDAR